MSSFQSFVHEQLNRAVPPVRARRMFGGMGLYSSDVFFALIADDALYLKTNASTQPDFEAKGMGPFRPFGDDGGTMGYHQLPEEVLEDPEELRAWCEKSIAVARAARVKPKTRRK